MYKDDRETIAQTIGLMDAVSVLAGKEIGDLIVNYIDNLSEILEKDAQRTAVPDSEKNCNTCKYFSTDEADYPCTVCKNNYVDRWESK
jgi:uncharacterized paraquat-inducible protein A